MFREWKDKLIAKWFNSPTFPINGPEQANSSSYKSRRGGVFPSKHNSSKRDLLFRSFPLERGTQIVLENGFVFQVCQQEFRGAIAKVSIRLKPLPEMHNVSLLQHMDESNTKWETSSFSSMGELEQFIRTHQEEVKDLISPNNERKIHAQ